MNILTLTINPTIDTNSSIDHVSPDKKLRCRKPTHEPGGGGINVSRAINKMGGESLAIYPSGGTHGQRLNELLRKEDVDISPVDIREPTRENFMINEDVSDKQYRFVMPGPELTEDECDELIKRVCELKDESDYLVASGSLPAGVSNDFYCRLADNCRKEDIKIILDTSGEPLKKAFAEGIFLIKPNMAEMNNLLGEEINNEDKLAERAQQFIKKSGTEYVVLSLGSGGAMLITAETYKHFRAPTVQIKSKVGAGDSTVAGIVLALSRGKDIEEAVKYGIAAGASAVKTCGTQLCNKEDVDNLYKKLQSIC